MISPATQSQAQRDRHVRNATRLLCEALHYHRFFGALDPRVASHALKAGQSARYSDQLCEAWATRCPEAYAVPEIRAAMAIGWVATERDLTECVDVVDGSVQS